ncbi:transmembrane protein 126 [Colletes latitarsis]|uniref:transmembrane protein 126 n=1 Tax=Colletes latitarsis TaxID=2605962 RepID=UPI004036103D
MALIPLRSWGDLRKGDIINIPRSEAIEYQENLIKKWEPQSEVLPFKYGASIISSTATLSGLLINNMFRRKLQLRHHGRAFSMLSITVSSYLLSNVFHNEFVEKKIMLYSFKCPLCLEIRASSIVNFCGLVYPLIMAPTLNLALAGSVGLRVPHIKEVRELSKFWWSVVKLGATHLVTIAFINSVIASQVTNRQILSMETVRNVMLRIEDYRKENEIEPFE